MKTLNRGTPINTQYLTNDIPYLGNGVRQQQHVS